MHKNVLIISYTFPPTGGAGVQRISKFVKYLPQFGWDPIVLTPSNPSVPLKDDSLLKDIPYNTKIYKSRTLEPSYDTKLSLNLRSETCITSKLKTALKSFARNVLLPDPQILWWPGLTLSILSTIFKEKIDCIFATSPPFSALIPPVIIGKMFNIPVVIDFRDEWAFVRQNTENATNSKLAKHLDKLFESITIHACSDYTAATQGYVKNIKERHLNTHNKGTVLTNGYDTTDIVNRNITLDEETITISYIGSIWKETSLKIFIEAYKDIATRKPSLPIKLKIIGRIVDSERDYIDRAIDDCSIEISGYQPHNTAILEMANADILLLTLSDSPGSKRIIPGKTFEYMASGRHILAMIPQGETYNLLEKHYPNTTFADPNNAIDIGIKLRTIINDIRNIRSTKEPNVEQYSRVNLTKSLVTLLNKCTT